MGESADLKIYSELDEYTKIEIIIPINLPGDEK